MTRPFVSEKHIHNWPGWSLCSNEHGDEFDEVARQRMVVGGLELNRHIYKYLFAVGESILEIGPFFNPITKKIGEGISGKSVIYWENDPHAIQWLQDQCLPFSFRIKQCDLNKIDRSKPELLKEFDSVIASQVFNYVDYVVLLQFMHEKINSGGLLFINNVIDYGLPKFFVEKRPKSIEETLYSVEKSGFEVVEYEIMATQNPLFQKHDRLLLVAKNK
jgi:phospholipid N-methyltransferase